MEFSSHLSLRMNLMRVMSVYIKLKLEPIKRSQLIVQLVLSSVDAPVETAWPLEADSSYRDLCSPCICIQVGPSLLGT